jgi:Carboxypeptidase regulatory-like domain
MRRAILFMVFCPGLIAQDAAGIDGVAIDAVTHQPMQGVHVTLRLIEGDEKYGAITSRDGHFSITGMAPAIYSLRAQRNGYIHMPAANVTLKPGEHVTGLTVEMTLRAVIEGHVLDENGDPVQHVDVSALAAVAGSPESKVAMVMDDRSDDRGHFRLILPPGKFYVTTPEMRSELRSDEFGPLVYGATWYPGAESKDRATAIEIAPGHDVTGIDMYLTRTRGMAISGTITGLLANAESPTVLVFFRDEGRVFVSQEIVAGADGKFTSRGLTPRPYRFVAKQVSADTMVQSPPVDVEPARGGEVRVNLAMVPGGAVSGTLEVVGDPPKIAPAERLTVRLESYSQRDVFAPAQAKGADTGPDGAFRIEPVFPEELRVRVLPMPENAFIKSVKLDGVEEADAVLDLSGGVREARIKVTLSRSGGQVEGSVLGEDGVPLQSPLAYVALAARIDDIDRDGIKAVAAGEKFRYTGLRPGKYRLMAVDPRKSSAEVHDFEALFPNAPEFEIGEGDRIAKDIAVISAEKPGAKP